MSKVTRSARGDFVDFELLAIKAQLAAKPAPRPVIQRREVIEERDGVKPLPTPAVEELLALATEATATAVKDAPKRK